VVVADYRRPPQSTTLACPLEALRDFCRATEGAAIEAHRIAPLPADPSGVPASRCVSDRTEASTAPPPPSSDVAEFVSQPDHFRFGYPRRIEFKKIDTQQLGAFVLNGGALVLGTQDLGDVSDGELLATAREKLRPMLAQLGASEHVEITEMPVAGVRALKATFGNRAHGMPQKGIIVLVPIRTARKCLFLALSSSADSYALNASVLDGILSTLKLF
jgi:hypothetical protein